MQVSVKDLEKSKLEISVELSLEEFSSFIVKGAEKVSASVKIEGFRPGKVPYDILKQKIGEMGILEEAANLAINKTIDEVIENNTNGRQAVGQPQVSITKLAPDNPLEYKVIVSLLPEISLGKYKDLGLKAEQAVVKDEEIDRALRDFQELRAKESASAEAAAKGDKVVMDINLFLDKVPVEGGQHQDLAVILGKQYLVPGFDEQIMGLKQGEEKSFDLGYPKNHHQKHLAGKNVTFNIKIKEVFRRELPPLDDKLAEAFRLKSLDELKDNLRHNMLHEKEHQLEHKQEAEMISKIADDSKFGELPEEIIGNESRNMLAELEQSVIRQGGKFEDYLSHLQKTKEALILEMAPNAVKRVKSALIIREIAKAEKIAPSEEEIETKIKELKEQYKGNAEVEKMLAEAGYRSYLRNVLTNEQVIAKLKEWNYASSGAKQES